MEPDEISNFLDHLAEGHIERGLAFRLQPSKVREALSGLVKEQRNLWFQHLLQLLYDVELDEPVSLSTIPKSQMVRIEIVPRCPTFLESLTPAKVEQREGLILAGDPASAMARILCEAATKVLYRHADAPQALLATTEAFHLFPADQVQLSQNRWKPARGLSLELSFEALGPSRALFGPGPSIIKDLWPLTGVHPNPPAWADRDVMNPDWPFRPESATSILQWDWESVVPDPDGFRWMVGSGSDPVAATDTFDHRVVWNLEGFKRAWTELPVLSCYPDALARQLATGRPPGKAVIRANRVLGIATCATENPQDGGLYPIVKGIPVPPLRLASGLFMAADASALLTDASGIRLVHDDAFQAWRDELVEWALRQLKLYLPLLGSMAEYGRRRNDAPGSPPATGWLRKWRAAVDDLFKPVPTPLQIRARQELFAELLEG